MIVRIPDQDSYKVTGTNGQMVGNLESGDYTIVGFAVSSISRTGGNLIVQIDYTDNIGERRSVLKEISLNSGISSSVNMTGMASGEFPEGNFSRKGGINWTYVTIPILICLMFAGGFVIYKKREKIIGLIKKRKKEKKTIGVPEWIKKNKEK